MPDASVSNGAEFREALQALTPVQLNRLRLQGDALASGLPMTGEDLLQEAVSRTLEGSRRYRQDVDVSTYLSNAMRSIASAEREKARRQEPLGDPSDEASNIHRIASPERSPEETAIQKIDRTAALARLRELLSGDQDALALLEGRSEDLTNAEIMELESMDRRRFHAARKRLLRAAVRLGQDRGGK